jgi:hypothetical protein
MHMESHRGGSRVLSTTGVRSLRSTVSQLLAPAMGLVLLCAANSGHALNGGIRVISCQCQTPTDFVNMATSDNSLYQLNVTYTVVSTVTAETAYVRVTGHFRGTTEPVWVVGSATVVDASGNSLASYTADEQEAVFYASDQLVFGVDRDLPVVVTVVGATGNWGTMTDDEINMLIAGWFTINHITNPPATITLIFKDGSNNDLGGAKFSYSPSTGKYKFVEGYDAHGKPLDRHGNPLGSLNTSGHGSGDAHGNGFGPGAFNFEWQLTGHDVCTDSVTISGDWGDMVSQKTAPC